MGPFAKLAKAVIKDIKDSSLDKDLIPTEEQMESGIARLVSDNLLKLGDDAEDQPLPKLVELVRLAAGKIQKESGVLSIDMLFGVKTLNWLQFASRCFGKMRRDWQTDEKYRKDKAIDSSVRFTPLEVRYFIKELPVVVDGNPLLLLREAWESWSKVCGMVSSQCPTESNANVIVTVENIDGPSNVLGDAHIGPPERTRLTLRFDKADTFTSFKFQATACHEIGHLLGLEHSGTPNQLMVASLGTLKTPQSEDATRAQMFWGPPPKIKDVEDVELPDPVDA
ncbi:MAG: matrixin family metalloprotease [Pirellulaceae bacterium]